MPARPMRPASSRTLAARPFRHIVAAAGVLAFLALAAVQTASVAQATGVAREFQVADANTNAAAPSSTPGRPPRTSLTNPLGTTSIQTLAGRAVRIFLGVGGSVALLMFVYGGFMWTTAAGNPDKIKKGKNVFIWAVIGLIFMFVAYPILLAFFQVIGLATPSGS